MERLSLCSQIRRLNIGKMSILSKLTYRFNEISIKIPAKYFVEKNLIIPKSIWKGKGITIAKFFFKVSIKWKELLHPILRHVLHNQNCAIGRGIEKQINGTEQTTQK